MAASNSDWPVTEHNKIARLILKSVNTTGTDGGALGNQNWNDYAFDSTGEGHILDVEHRLRQEPAQYESGVALTLKNSAGAALTTGNSSTAVELVTSEGKIFQLHLHTFPALDMYSSDDDAHIANQVVDEGGAYSSTEDLVTDITHYVDGSDAGVAIGTNKYFNLVIWGIINREGEVSHLMINLPTGRYTTSANAIADVDGTSTFDIPLAFKGTGFLIARLTFRLIAGAQWTYIAQEDLRGQTPVVSAGVGVTTTDHALLANLIAPADDHTQYLLADGTRALAGAWDMGSQALTNVNIDSGVITVEDLISTDDITMQGHLLTMGDVSAAVDTVLSFLGSTNSASITFDESANEFEFGDADITTIGNCAFGNVEPYYDNTSYLGHQSWRWKGLFLSGDANIGGSIELGHASDTTLTRASAGNLNIEGNLVYRAGGTDVPIADGGTGQGTAQAAIDALSAVSGATNEHVLTKDTGTGQAIWKAAAGGGAGATTELDNLGVVAINTSLISDTATTDDLGSAAKPWKDLYLGQNIYLPATSATAGVIKVNNVNYIHFYGNENFFLGSGAGNLTLTGGHNTAIGADALGNLENGGENVAIGNKALENATSAYQNIALGRDSMLNCTSGTDNIAIGTSTLDGLTTGANCIAIGPGAVGNSNANHIIGIGTNTFAAINTGIENIGIGCRAFEDNTDGNYGVAIGHHALRENTTGVRNTAIGRAALLNNTTGEHNVAIGMTAGYAGNGSSNVFIGYYAGRWETGSNKLFIDDVLRTDEADSRVKALIYGIFAAATADQYLSINAAHIIVDDLPSGSDQANAGAAAGELWVTSGHATQEDNTVMRGV